MQGTSTDTYFSPEKTSPLRNKAGRNIQERTDFQNIVDSAAYELTFGGRPGDESDSVYEYSANQNTSGNLLKNKLTRFNKENENQLRLFNENQRLISNLKTIEKEVESLKEQIRDRDQQEQEQIDKERQNIQESHQQQIILIEQENTNTINKLRKSIQFKENHVKVLEKTLRMLTDDLNDKVAIADKDISRLENQISVNQNTLDTQKNKYQELLHSREDTKRKNDVLESEIEQLSSELDQILQETEECESDIKKLDHFFFARKNIKQPSTNP